MSGTGAPPSPDAELVCKIQSGLIEAEAELYAKHSGRVYNHALRKTRSPQDAEDVRNETFLRVLQAIRGNHLKSASSLASFVLGTTRNVLHEFMRRGADRAARSDLSADCAPTQEAMFIDADARRVIAQTIAQLKPREQELLRLYYYEELPRADIARRCGLAQERVRLVKSRALNHFREIYHNLELQTHSVDSR